MCVTVSSMLSGLMFRPCCQVSRPNFKDLENGDQLNYLLNSDGSIVKAVARFFYLANLMHSSVNMN